MSTKIAATGGTPPPTTPKDPAPPKDPQVEKDSGGSGKSKSTDETTFEPADGETGSGKPQGSGKSRNDDTTMRDRQADTLKARMKTTDPDDEEARAHLAEKIEQNETLEEAAKKAKRWGAGKDVTDTLLNTNFTVVDEDKLGSDAAAARNSDGKNVMLISDETMESLQSDDKEEVADAVALLAHEGEHFDTAHEEAAADVREKTFARIEEIEAERDLVLARTAPADRADVMAEYDEKAVIAWNRVNEVPEYREQLSVLKSMDVKPSAEQDPTTRTVTGDDGAVTVVKNSDIAVAREVAEDVYTEAEVGAQADNLFEGVAPMSSSTSTEQASAGAAELDGDDAGRRLLGPGRRLLGPGDLLLS